MLKIRTMSEKINTSVRSHMIWPELELEPFYFFFRSQSILKNWNGAGAGINKCGSSSF